MNWTVHSNICYAPEHGAAGMLDLYLPETEAPCPLFIYFHGGGLESGARTDYMGTFRALSERGIAVASVEYRLLRFADGHAQLAPDSAQFPDFIADCAQAVAWLHTHGEEFHAFDAYYIGGSSAGGYLAMMLCLNARWLERYGLDPMRINGYLFDAGQPTTHFNVLAARGQDARLVRIDEAAPLYWIDHPFDASRPLPRLLIVYAEFDMTNRPEQTQLLYRTLLHFGYDDARISLKCMKGYRHCAYCGEPDVFAPLIAQWIQAEAPHGIAQNG